MRLTKSQVRDKVRMGDTIIVHYNHGGVVAAGIQWYTKGDASHELCCLGGFDIIEADIGGVMHTNLDTYLRGTCRLTLRRPRPGLLNHERAAMREYWVSQVAKPYGFGAIAQSLIAVPVRGYLLPRFPRLARAVLTALAFVFRNARPDCSALYAEGWRRARKGVLPGYDSEEVTPELLLRTQSGIETISVWDDAILSDKE